MRPLLQTVVVGYDGSPPSRAAIDAAIDRLAPDGCLFVVHGFVMPSDWLANSYHHAPLDRAQLSAADLLERIEEDCPRLAGVSYETELIVDAPASAICRAAKVRDADEIVIGSRGRGRLGALVGSVAMGVVHQAECPVLIIPERVTAKDLRAAEAAAAS